MQEKIGLIELLNRLEQRYDVKFNYAEDKVSGVQAIMPSQSLSIEQALQSLQNQTGFLFDLRPDNIVLVAYPEDLKLCGYIRDAEDLNVISDVTLQSGSDATVSDENGYFEISVKARNEEILIRHLGYRSLSRVYASFITDGCADVFLNPFIQPLEEVVISNFLSEGIDKLNDGSLQIDIDEFKILPGMVDADVLQTVQALPGILSINETVSNINIRGGTHDQNLILWDGIKMYQSGHFFGLISMYNPHITNKVSILKNGTPVDLTDGVSGTIAMKTEQLINNDFHAKVGLDLVDVNGFIDIPTGNNSSLQLAARKAISDLIETPTYDQFFDRIAQDTELDNNTNVINTDQKFDFYDTSLRWLYRISDRDELRLNFIHVSNELEFNERAVVNNIEQTRRSSLNQNSIAGGIYYNRIWSEELSSSIEVYETDYKLKAINANVIESQRFLQENKVSETSAKLKVNYVLNNNLDLLGGYHFVETQVTNLDDVDVPLYRLLVSEVVRTHGAFVQGSYSSPERRTTLKAGARYNYIEKFQKSIIEPRVSLTHRLDNGITFELLGEFKHQNTSQVINFQNDFLGIEKRRWQLSNNNDIPIIMSKQASAGIQYDNSGWLISVDAYFKLVEGLSSQSQGFQNQYQSEREQGQAETYGLDLLLRKRWDIFNGWLSYSFMNSTFDFPGLEPVAFPSNFDITHSITAGTTVSFENLIIAAGMNWRSGKPVTIPIAGNELIDGNINYGPTNAERLDSYMRVDLSGLYQFGLGSKTKAEVGVSVWNVLNRNNQLDAFYRVENDQALESIQPSLGITPNALFKVIFD